MANDANATGSSQEGIQAATTNSEYDNITVKASTIEDRILFRNILKQSKRKHGNSYNIVERTPEGYRLELAPGATVDNGVPLAYEDISRWEDSQKRKDYPCIKVLRPFKEDRAPRAPPEYPNDVIKDSRGVLVSRHYSGVYEDLKGDLWIDGGSEIQYRDESKDCVAKAAKENPEAKIKDCISGL
ncbi:hypothetical protein VFPPC_14874 [Pochonia chlamydosporia 170]|uniref:Uncharacterized protein n=1 Tax=Pochonia chlamydosporia 170 TaxID=1380566 RepID=A0A179FB22_METCM|nr:hypothetical protein VFPPC_14874 [Pochonia chlamydosporia 170]OAQ62664.1 hypothetical protein VFPPC_14874 [Pochonia chlamydosporia 170]